MSSRYVHIVEHIIKKVVPDSPHDASQIKKAFNIAKEAHKEDFRRSGAPFLEHPVEVARILSEMKVDATTIIAALLHDTVEDTNVTLLEVKQKFGEDVASIVEGVTKITEIHFSSLEEKQAENYRKLIISMIKDIRVIIIKFADRLHNMRTIKFMKPAKQLQKAKETLEVFAPLAYRLGMYKIKSEFEDLAFEIIEPSAYQDISNKMEVSRQEMQGYIDEIMPIIREELDTANIKIKIMGRVKHFYSIYRKLQTRYESFSDILDIIALRIITSSEEECFRVLHIIHKNFTPVKNMFSDFINNPKPNGYQSIHTKVTFRSRIIEIQIRSKEMHERAENGLAAHWRYKNSKTEQPDAIDTYINKLKNVLEYSFNSNDPHEILEELKLNLISENMFVFTPKKDLVVLPKGATAIDFAYKIHDSIGNHCIAAKVGGKIIPLSLPLENGDVIEIITSENSSPTYEWLNYAKSQKARSGIRNFFKKSSYDRTYQLGKDLFYSEMENYGIKVTQELMSDLSNSFGFNSREKFFVAIGDGKIKPIKFIRKIMPKRKASLMRKLHNMISFRNKSKKKENQQEEISSLTLNIQNKKNITFGKCCNPLPGDNIIGINKAGHIEVHISHCPSIKETKYENQVQIKWDTNDKEKFNVRFRIMAEDRQNLLLDIIKIIASLKVNINEITVKNTDKLVTAELVAEVSTLNKYITIRKKILNIKSVINVERIIGEKLTVRD